MASEQVAAALALDALGGDAREGFALAAEAGYAGIAFATNHAELNPEALGESARRHVRKLLETKHLSIHALRAAAPRAGVTDPATIQRTMDNARAAIRLAHDLGVGTVALNLGPLGATGAAVAGVVGAVRELAEAADRAGVTLALGSEAVTPLEELLKAVAFDRARANLDAAGLIGAAEDPLKAAELLAGKIGVFTAADAVRSGNRVRAAELGEGQLPLVELLEILQESDFRGPTVVDVRELRDVRDGAMHAAEVLRKLGR